MPQSVDNGVVTGGQQGRRPPTLSPPSSHNLHLSLTRSSHFTHNDSSRLIFDALCLHPLRHTTCCLKERRINFLNLFQFFPPLSFPRFFFSIYCKLKIVPKKVITVVKSLHITIRLYRRTSLCASRTTTRTNMYSKVPRSTILWTHSHLLGGLCC